MSIYLLEVMWCLICAPLLKCNIKINRKIISGKQVYLIILFSVAGMIMALRAPCVGTDTQTYYNMFYRIKNANGLFDAFKASTITAPVYVFYVFMLSKLFASAQIVTIINSLIIVLGFAIYIYKYSKNVLFSCYLFMGLTLSLEAFNGARQFIAIVLVLNSFFYLKDNLKSVKGWILFILAVGIHNTAIIALLGILGILLLNNTASYRKLFTYVIIGSLIFGIMFYMFISLFLRYFPHYSMYIDGTNPASIINKSGSGRIVILYIALLMVLILYFIIANKNNWKFVKNDMAELPVAIFCTVTGILFCKNNLFNRMLWYFLSMYICLIPCIYEKMESRIRYILYCITFIGLFAYFCLFLNENKGGIIPYLFFWSY